MKHPASDNGVTIENTLSIALQKRNLPHTPLYMLMIAVLGVFGSVFSFLSMFQPCYHPFLLVTEMILVFGVAAFLAWTPEKYRILKLLLYLGYLLSACMLRKVLFSGFAYLMNDIYGCVNETDMEYFHIESEISHAMSCTVFLIFASAFIIFLICFAALRYHNFFLCILATMPYLGVGLYLGLEPNCYSFSFVIAFLCSMAAIQIADFSSYHSNGKMHGFHRRNNLFFPSGKMQFMLSEYVGFLTAVLTMVLCISIHLTAIVTNYHRSDKVKQMRTDFIYYCENFSFESSLLDAIDFLQLNSHQTSVSRLGQDDKLEYENVSVATVDLSDLPESRVYLKNFTGSIYQKNQWTALHPSVFEHPVFSAFEQLDIYPQDFPFIAAEGVWNNEVMTITYTNADILSDYVPYGIHRDAAMTCKEDNGFYNFSDQYTLYTQTNYEQLLEKLDQQSQSMRIDEILYRTPEESQDTLLALLDQTLPMTNTRLLLPETEEKMEVSALCMLGYTDFVKENYLYIPDTIAMEHVQNAYDDLFSAYDASTATPARTLMFLKQLRDRMCSNVQYTLAPGKTPSGEDFVEYFLLKNKAGYCVHYATAGTILARIAGIPARYCEGYLLDCTQNGLLTVNDTDDPLHQYTAQILDHNAHAWTEIYIEGIGWIPFEFTFTYFNTQEVPPVSTILPTEMDTDVFSETQANTASSETEILELTTQESIVSVETETSDHSSAFSEPLSAIQPHLKEMVILLGGITAMILGIIGILFSRNYAIARRKRQMHQENIQQAAIFTEGYLQKLMHICGVQKNRQSISAFAEEAEEKCQKFMKQLDITSAILICSKLHYGNDPITQEELQYLCAASKELAAGIYHASSVPKKLYLQWILHYI